MKITKLLSNLILENSRFAALLKLTKPVEKKGKKIISPLTLDYLKQMIKTDPTSVIPDGFDIDSATEEEMEKVKVGKYVQWMIKHFLKPDENLILRGGETSEPGTKEYEKLVVAARKQFMEDLFKLNDDLKKYDRFKNQFQGDDKDITKITPRRVYELVKDLKLSKTKGEIKKERVGYSHPGATIEIQTPNWTVVKIEGTGPEQHEAAKFYGGYYLADQGETRWCTSSPGLSYWRQYLSQGPLYVVLPNDDKGKVGEKSGLPVERYQFHFQSNQFMDREDHSVDLPKMLLGPMIELKDYFKPEFARGLSSSDGEKIEVSYPSGSSGVFVRLYGFNGLFDAIDKKRIRQLLVSNTSNENIDLEVPASLGEMINLEAILFQKMVKSLPKEIGNLKNLNFLSLPNNPKLKTLPDNLSNCESLSLINLQDTPAKLPTTMVEKFTESDNGFYWAV